MLSSIAGSPRSTAYRSCTGPSDLGDVCRWHRPCAQPLSPHPRLSLLRRRDALTCGPVRRTAGQSTSHSTSAGRTHDPIGHQHLTPPDDILSMRPLAGDNPGRPSHNRLSNEQYSDVHGVRVRPLHSDEQQQ